MDKDSEAVRVAAERYAEAARRFDETRGKVERAAALAKALELRAAVNAAIGELMK